MSLHDIDKAKDNRGIPRPNQSDHITQRYAHGTVQNQNSQEEAQEDGLKFLERQIIAKQNGFNKAVFGFYGDANKFGLKVAEDDVDVLLATDDQLNFNSEQNVFKIVDSGTISGSTATVSRSTVGASIDSSVSSVSHNLGYIPAIIGYLYDGTSYYLLPATIQTATNGSHLSIQRASLTVDSTKVYLAGYTEVLVLVAGAVTQNASALTVKYYLLQETAN